MAVEEALRPKLRGGLPELRITLRDVRRHDDQRPGGDLTAREYVALLRVTRYQPHGGIEPHRLVEDRARPRQTIEVVVRRSPLAQHLIELPRHLALHRGITGEQPQRPRESARGRLVPGDKEGHQLIAHLGSGNGRIGCGRFDEQVQESGWLIRGARALSRGHHRGDGIVELHERCAESARGSRRQPVGWLHGHLGTGNDDIECLDGGARKPIRIP